MLIAVLVHGIEVLIKSQLVLIVHILWVIILDTFMCLFLNTCGCMARKIT